MEKVLHRFRGVFASSIEDLPGSDIVDIKVRLKEKPDYRRRCYPMNPLIRQKFVEETKAMLKAGIIKPAPADVQSWSSCVPVVKSNGEVRPTVDLRPLNKICEAEKEIAVTTDEIFRWFGEAVEEINGSQAEEEEMREILGWSSERYYDQDLKEEEEFLMNKMDFKSGFFQLKLRPEDARCFAFEDPQGKRFVYRRLPMGWVNSTVFFNRAMKRLTSEPSPMGSTRTYINDVLQRG